MTAPTFIRCTRMRPGFLSLGAILRYLEWPETEVRKIVKEHAKTGRFFVCYAMQDLHTWHRYRLAHVFRREGKNYWVWYTQIDAIPSQEAVETGIADVVELTEDEAKELKRPFTEAELKRFGDWKKEDLARWPA